MTFYVESLNSHEVMPLMKLFEQRHVEKTHKLSSSRGVAEHHKTAEQTVIEQQSKKKQSRQSGIAIQSYHVIGGLQHSASILIASEIMTSTVMTLLKDNTVGTAMELFQSNKFRHIPVTSREGVIQGIVSDRDLFRYLSGVSKDFEQKKLKTNQHDKIAQLMTQGVLTASLDTDVRFIARLFVERQVGAMPIVSDGKLVGIITRSDLMGAIMQNFKLELWS